MSFYVTAQSYPSLYGQVGLNRIGLGQELGVDFIKNKHSKRIGLKLYAPDILFQHNMPGLSTAIAYKLIEKNRFDMFSGIQLDLFYEWREINNIFVWNPWLFIQPTWKLSKKWSWNTKISLGNVFSSTKSPIGGEQENYSYINYEISIGVAYRFADAD